MLPSLAEHALTCRPCPPDSYCLAGRQYTCPARSSSSARASSVADCTCTAGRFLVNGSCALCGEHHYCDANARHSCPPDSGTQHLEATSVTECRCRAGTFLRTTPAACEPCPQDNYCPGDQFVYPCGERQRAAARATARA
eukprot:3210248-Rhodomonas_salina.1